jgi:hypothetical protein
MKDHKPIYLLKYSNKEIESSDVQELMRLAKNITDYWELFRVMKSEVHKSEHRSYITCEEVDEVKRLHGKGYSAKVICNRVGLTKDRYQLVIGQNAII